MTLSQLMHVAIPIFLVSIALTLTGLGMLANCLARDSADVERQDDADGDAAAAVHDANSAGPQGWLKM
jgi:hypothetical protein